MLGNVLIKAVTRMFFSDWNQYYIPHNLSREDWLPHLKKLNISSLCTSEIDYKTGQLDESLLLMGANLTILHLQADI